MEAHSQYSAGAGKGIPTGLLRSRDIDTLGWDLRRVYPVNEVPCFVDLLRAIDEATA